MNGVEIKIESIKKPCGAGLKVGDTWRLVNKDGQLIMKGFDGACPEVFGAVFSTCMTLAYSGKLPWEDGEGKVFSACPDPNSQVVVSMKRIPMENGK
jgi:uncharacterized repeat protein (TIGR04076 family)